MARDPYRALHKFHELGNGLWKNLRLCGCGAWPSVQENHIPMINTEQYCLRRGMLMTNVNEVPERPCVL